MKIVFTSARSFTGSWFAEALAEAGHAVLAVQGSGESSYRGLRRERLDRLRFGSPAFLLGGWSGVEWPELLLRVANG